MPIPFIMPKFDMDQTSATIVEWLRSEGDFVQRDEEVLVIETEKVAAEVLAPASGILSGIAFQVGDEVPVTEIIAYILEEGESADDIPKPVSAPFPAKDSPDKVSSIPATPVAARMAKDLGIPIEDLSYQGSKITKSDVRRYADGITKAEEAGRTPATPSARRLAKAMGIDLNAVAGSGPRGRVQADDVRQAAEPSAAAAPDLDRPATIQPLTSMRRTIAERMQRSYQNTPHISLSVDLDVSKLEAAREQLSASAIKAGERKISITALLVFSASRMLSAHPQLNASYINDQIYLWKEVNIGVAIALPDGLIAPVVHSANELDVFEINKRLGDLVGRAETGQLSLDDVRGGTFTISNLGMFGIDQFRAIINPPESAILAVGRVRRKPYVTGQADKIDIRPVMNLTLSADHRVVDGAVAARFLSDLAQRIRDLEFPGIQLSSS